MFAPTNPGYPPSTFDYGQPPDRTGFPELPVPPPSVSSKGPSVFDKDHISETLLNIGAALLSNQNFGEGLGAAAKSIAGRQGDIRKEALKSVTYGGPDDQFEIVTDGRGNRTVREVPEFAAAVKAKADAKRSPNAETAADLRARALYNISQLPAEQRPAAYLELRANPQAYGIDATGMPDQWSDSYGKVAGGMGLNVNQALSQVRNDRLADNRIATNDARTEQGAARVAQGATRVDLATQAGARAASKSKLSGAPPSARGTAKLPTGFILN